MPISALDILIVIIVLIVSIIGYKKGFLKTLFSLGSSVLSIFLSVKLYAPLADYLKTTFLNKEITTLVMNFVKPQIGDLTTNSLTLKQGYNAIGLPQMFYKWVTAGVDASKIENTVTSIAKTISQGIAGVLIDIFAIVLVFFLVKALLLIVKGLIFAISKLPLIKHIDKGAGLILGVVNGCLITYLLMAIIFFTVTFSNSTGDYSDFIKKDLKKSHIAQYMYKGNFIVNLLVNENTK